MSWHIQLDNNFQKHQNQIQTCVTLNGEYFVRAILGAFPLVCVHVARVLGSFIVFIENAVGEFVRAKLLGKHRQYVLIKASLNFLPLNMYNMKLPAELIQQDKLATLTIASIQVGTWHIFSNSLSVTLDANSKWLQ